MDDGDETTYEKPMFLCLNLKIHLYWCLLVNETKNPQHLDCVRSMPATHGDKTIPDSAEPRLESFYLLFVAGIDLSQGAVYSYNLYRAVRYGLIHFFCSMGLSPDTSIAGCACAGNAGNVFPATDFKGNR